MTDVIELLRAHDPERGGTAAPPIEPLLARLDAEPEPRGRRRPRRRRPHRRGRVAVAVALACLGLIALVAVALGGGGGGDRRDALTPAGGADVIVHTVARSVYTGKGGRRTGAVLQVRGRRIGTMDGPVEGWRTSGPTRWRSVTTLLPGRGMPGGTIEQAYADGVARTRESWERRTRVQRMPDQIGGGIGVVSVGPFQQGDGRLHLLAGVPDPRAAIARMLRSGEVRAAGETTRDGRRLLRFVGATGLKRMGRNATRPATRTTYLVDAGSYAPVIVETAMAMPRHGARGGPLGPFHDSGTIVFDTYENLPLTSETAPLLRFGGPTR